MLHHPPARRRQSGAFLALSVVMLAETACGGSSGTRGPGDTTDAVPVGSSAARPSVTALSDIAPTPNAGPVIAVLDRPFGSVPNAVHVLTLDGTEVALAALADTTEAAVLAGRRVLIAGDGVIQSVGPGGPAEVVGKLEEDGPDIILRGLIADADGTHWMWSAVRQNGDGTVVSHLYSGSVGSATRLIGSHAETGRALVPVAWTAGGPVVADEQVGIGGYVLFRRAFGPTQRVDWATGAMTPLTDQACAFSDLGTDGTTVCVLNGREDAHAESPVVLRVTRPGLPPQDVVTGATSTQAGAAYLSPDASQVTLAESPALATDVEIVTGSLVRLADGSRRALPVGVVPQRWLSNGTILAARSPGVSGGEPGTYAVGTDGSIRLLTPSWVQARPTA